MKDGSQKPFSFRIIAINDELLAVANEEDALVIFGLAKPYHLSVHKMAMLYLSNRFVAR